MIVTAAQARQVLDDLLADGGETWISLLEARVIVSGPGPTNMERRDVLLSLAGRELVVAGELDVERGGQAFAVTQLGKDVAAGLVEWPAPEGAAVAVDSGLGWRSRLEAGRL